jgi:hypothetical protein
MKLSFAANGRSWAACIAIATAAATFGTLSTASYCIGRGVDPELSFLDPQRAPTVDEAIIAQALTYAIRSREMNDVVFLGDSTCRMGIKPELFSRISGLSGWNLASMRRIGPYGYAITVALYLQNHPAPRVVVLCVNPVLFEVDPTTLDGEFQQRLKWSYNPESAPIWENVPFVTKREAARSIGFWSRDVRNEPLDGLARETYNSLRTKSRAVRGFFALPGEHGPANGIPMETPVVAVRGEWSDGLISIARDCRAHGACFLIIFGPLTDSLAKARDWSLLAKWARDFERSEPRAFVAEPIFYEERLMWDALHVNAAGLEKFVPTVAADVQAVLSK